MKRFLVVAALLALPAVSRADQATARQDYEDGEKAYNLGDFSKAVDLFKKAYEEWPEPSFLFNIAQTYRQMGDCKQALFFYKRFLALKEQDKKKPLPRDLKAEVETRISELDACVKNGGGTTTSGASATPTTSTTSTTSTTPTTSTTSTATTATTPSPDSTVATSNTTTTDSGAPATTGASTMAVRVVAGASKLSVGPLDTGGLQFASAVVGGYPLAVGDKLTLELGASLGFNPVPYTTTNNTSGMAKLFAIMANVAPSLRVASNVSLRADIGAGALIVSGLGMAGNPFSETGMSLSGTTVFHVQAGVSADYAINRQIVLTATPITFGYSPAPSGFLTDISSMTTLAFMVGVGYRN